MSSGYMHVNWIYHSQVSVPTRIPENLLITPLHPSVAKGPFIFFSGLRVYGLGLRV